MTSIVVASELSSMAGLAGALGLDYAHSDWQRRDPGVTSDWQHIFPPEQLWWENYVVHCASLAEARNLLPLLRGEGRAKRVVLVVAGISAPGDDPAWTPRSLQSKARTSLMMVPGIGFAVVIEGAKWVNVHAAALAALRCASDVTAVPVLGGLRVGITDASSCSWLAGDALGSFMTETLLNPAPDDIYAVDVVVGAPELAHVEGRTSPAVWAMHETLLPPVDTSVISPRGFLPYPDKGVLALDPAQIGTPGELSELDLEALRRHSYLTVDGPRFSGADTLLARRLAQLAVAGIPMLAQGLPGEVRSLLDEGLAERIDSFNAADSNVLRESKSIDMRRTALGLYSPKPRWNTVLGILERPLLPLPSVSVVLATRRPDKLASALEQLGRQSWEAMETVVVLHGFESDLPEVKQAIENYPREVTVCSMPAETVFGEVLNAGVRAAGGDLITKMDDDDWYGEHHIRDLVHARSYSSATLLGCQVEFVYLESLDITTRRPPAGEMYSDHVAGGTMMIGKDDLRQLGGWRPVHRAVDRCLLQSVQAAGGLIYRTHGQNYMMHRHAGSTTHGGHTWNPEDSVFLHNSSEQWDGFAPPPQIAAVPSSPAGERLDSMRSHFARF
jgi:hypothetical protein